MTKIQFTANLQQHVDCPELQVQATSVRHALELVFEENPQLQGYVVDEQGALRQHVVVFLNGQPIRDRDGMSDEIADSDDLFVFQALSGG